MLLTVESTETGVQGCVASGLVQSIARIGFRRILYYSYSKEPWGTILVIVQAPVSSFGFRVRRGFRLLGLARVRGARNRGAG